MMNGSPSQGTAARSSLELSAGVAQAGGMADMDEAAMAVEGKVGATKAAVEAGITMEAVEVRTITTIGALTRPRQVTVLWHLHRPQKGTYLQW